MADDRDVRVRFIANVSNYTQGVRQAGRATRDFGREVSGRGRATEAQLQAVGRSSLLMAAGMAGGFALATKAAIDWESAWTGVLKTVDGSDEELGALEDGLRRMATELPATHTEIAAVAEAAGQLGISTPAIEDFTRTMIDLGETTNLSAGEAATNLARVANIMQTSQSDFDRMGSTVVDLGNNMATTESEIVEFSTRLAAAGQIAGLSEADVFAFGAAMTSVGVRAEAGGTALSKVFTGMRDAVLTGTEELDTFADVAGMTVDEFVTAFEDDPAQAIDSFIRGLGTMNEAGESTTEVFEALSLTDQRLMRSLLSAASAGDVLTEALEIGNRAWEDNTALASEAEMRYDTTAAQMQILRNRVTDLAVDAGSTLLPVLNNVVEAVGDMAVGFAEMPGPIRTAGLAFGGVSTAGLTVLGVTAMLVPKVRILRASMMGMGTAGQFVGRNMGRMATGVGLAAVAIAGVSYIMGQNAKKAEEARQRMLGFADAIREAGDAAEGTASEIARVVGETPDLARMLNDAEVSVADLSRAIHGSDDDWEQMRDRLLATADAAGESTLAFATFLHRMRDDAREAVTHVENVEGAVDGAGDAASGAAGQVGEMTDAFDDNKTAAEEAEDAVKNYRDTLRAMFDPWFGAIDALQKNAEAQDDVTAAEWKLIAATQEYDKAIREHGQGSDEAREASMKLLEAQGNLEDANYDAVRSAFDLDGALNELQIRLAGGMSLDEAEAKLDSWADQGWITEQQAADLAEELGIVRDEAHSIPSEITISFYADTSEFDRKFGVLTEQARSTRSHTIPIGPGRSVGMAGRALGGPVQAGTSYLVNEDTPRSETIVPVTDGRVLTQQQAMQALSAATGGGGGPIVNLNVDGTGLDTEALAEVVLRKAGWQIQLAGVR